MSKTVTYLTIEQIILIHEDQLERYGGKSGLHSPALLESAALRPQASFAKNDLYPSVFEKAAALMHSLVANHPFIDGNKRTAVASALIFLEFNGYSLRVAPKKLVVAASKVEAKKWGVKKLARWFKKNSGS